MNIPVKRIARWGLLNFFGGTRRQQPGLAGLGAALAIIGWLRDRSGSGKELIYSQTLQPGEDVKIVLSKLNPSD